MGLSLSIAERTARLRADMRMGVGVVLSQGEHAFLVMAAETLTRQRLVGFKGLTTQASIAITTRRAETLRARAYDGDLARLLLPIDASVDWISAVADPSFDLMTPMKGPFQSRRDGGAEIHRAAIKLCKQARLLPVALVGHLENATRTISDHGLNHLALQDFQSLGDTTSPLHEISSARLPLEVSQAGRLHVFRPRDGGEEHYAVEIGQPDRAKPVLTRLHSACFTGDLLHSLKCDCGPQLRSALQQIGRKGHGVLLYLNQEGRGIGLANKMRAYSLQNQGFDTVEANHRLGFEDDERDFRLGAEILSSLGFTSVRLMTNNPKKVDKMNEAGVQVVERVPLRVGRGKQNSAYLDTKAKKSGHLL